MDYWRSRLTEAKTKYSLSAAHCKDAGQDFIDRVLPAPDGGASMVTAIRAESRARNEYMRVLRIYTDLVVDGIVPKE